MDLFRRPSFFLVQCLHRVLIILRCSTLESPNTNAVNCVVKLILYLGTLRFVYECHGRILIFLQIHLLSVIDDFNALFLRSSNRRNDCRIITIRPRTHGESIFYQLRIQPKINDQTMHRDSGSAVHTNANLNWAVVAASPHSSLPLKSKVWCESVQFHIAVNCFESFHVLCKGTNNSIEWFI